MTRSVSPVAPRPLPSLAAVLYRHTRRLYLPTPQAGRRTPQALTEFVDGLAAHGQVVSRPLFEALSQLCDEQLRTVEEQAVGLALRELGAHRRHVPLFKGFPKTTPQDTYVFYLQRLLAFRHRSPGLPCALDGDERERGLSRAPSVTPERACVYGMFDPEAFGGCPVCHRRVGPETVEGREHSTLTQAREALRWVTRVDLGTDVQVQAAEVLTALLARVTPLSPADRDDLRVVLEFLGAGALPLLPEVVPVRETLALVLGVLLRRPEAEGAVLTRLADQVRTATDLLRVLEAAGGGDASLVGPVHSPRLPRALRRAVLERLEALDAQNLTEDLGRHAARWKRVGRNLHPFEFAARFPTVAVAFAALRGTLLVGDALGRQLRSAPGQLPGLRLEAGPDHERLRFIRWSGRVEAALAQGDMTAAALLGQRPGEFGRRLDALLRMTLPHGPAALGDVHRQFSAVVPRLTTPMLLLLRAHLPARGAAWPTRLVFPRSSPQAFALPDTRAVLPQSVTAPFVEAVTAELLARAGRLPHVELAVLDERLRTLPVPYAERSAARALVTLARGARLTLPAGRFARLFVHWMEHAQQRVDLDLSVALYGETWAFLGKCDFTHLRFAATGAVHSGDLTSAPAPLGASEFIDLDIETLRQRGVRYVVMTVLSFNGVPFETMAEAFAGYMLRASADGPVFEARAVEQRFDLRGSENLSVPLALDLGPGGAPTMCWLDTTPRARLMGEVVGHQVSGYEQVLGLSARRVLDAAGVEARPTLWDVAALHAAGRSDTVLVQHQNGRRSVYRRGGESPAAFLCRLTERQAPADGAASLPTTPALGFFLYHEQPLPPGSQVVALRSTVSQERGVDYRSFAQALGDLAPGASSSGR